MDQTGGVAMRPKGGDGFGEQVEARKLGGRPFGVVDLVDYVVVGEVGRRIVGRVHSGYFSVVNDFRNRVFKLVL